MVDQVNLNSVTYSVNKTIEVKSLCLAKRFLLFITAVLVYYFLDCLIFYAVLFKTVKLYNAKTFYSTFYFCVEINKRIQLIFDRVPMIFVQ